MKKQLVVMALINAFLIIFFTMPLTGNAETLPLITLEYPPWNYKDRVTGEPTGSSVEIVTEIFRRMGYEVKIDIKPWKRGQKEAAEGKYAGIFTFSKNPERERYFYYAEPISTVSAEVFFKRKDRDITFETLEDLKGKGLQMGTVDGYNQSDIFKNAVKEGYFETQPLASDNPDFQNLMKIKKGRIDLFVCPLNLCSFIIRENPEEFSDIDYIDKRISRSFFFYFAVPKKWPNALELKNRFNEELKKYALEGKLDEVHKKYGVVLVFNDSTDGKVEGFQEHYKWVK
jgi:polar amino acid transport system substrate-binding protein